MVSRFNHESEPGWINRRVIARDLHAYTTKLERLVQASIHTQQCAAFQHILSSRQRQRHKLLTFNRLQIALRQTLEPCPTSFHQALAVPGQTFTVHAIKQRHAYINPNTNCELFSLPSSRLRTACLVQRATHNFPRAPTKRRLDRRTRVIVHRSTPRNIPLERFNCHGTSHI